MKKLKNEFMKDEIVLSTTDGVRSRMSRQRHRDTKPELIIRKYLHARGLRCRVDCPLPGLPRRRADLLFSRKKVAIFVDGCFWHFCPAYGTTPKNNEDWWSAKLAANLERDQDTDFSLKKLGWTVYRIWEHEDMLATALVIERDLKGDLP